MEDITFIIKTFERRESLLLLMKSIATYYPNQKIIILDDSRKSSLNSYELKKLPKTIQFIRANFNIGLSAGRNILVSKVTTPFFLLLDDDFILEKWSNIEGGLAILKKYNYDLIGGECLDIEKELYHKRIFHGSLEVINKKLICMPYTDNNQELIRCDFVLNFFVAKTEAVQKLKWNDELKILEHLDFFWRAKQNKLKIGHFKKMYTKHYQTSNKFYRSYRLEKRDTYSIKLKKALKVNDIIFKDKVIKG